MSFDYFACRLTRPIESLKDLDESAASKEDWFKEGCSVLAAQFPELQWEHDGERFRGFGAHLGIGRFDAILSKQQGVVYLRVEGRGGDQQNAYVSRLANAVGATAFESPTGRRVVVQA
jgi:hypothetical protein